MSRVLRIASIKSKPRHYAALIHAIDAAIPETTDADSVFVGGRHDSAELGTVCIISVWRHPDVLRRSTVELERPMFLERYKEYVESWTIEYFEERRMIVNPERVTLHADDFDDDHGR